MTSLDDLVRTWSDKDQKQYYAAKYVAEKLKLNKFSAIEGKPAEKWFEDKFGISIADYRKEVKSLIKQESENEQDKTGDN